MKNMQAIVGRLNAEIFAEVEESQGASYISDGMDGLTKAQFFIAVRGCLRAHLQARDIIREFLRRHGEWPEPSRKSAVRAP